MEQGIACKCGAAGTGMDQIKPGLTRIVAPNGGPMTHEGTCTYVLGNRAVAVIDPGPDHDGHLNAILAAVPAGGAVSHIIVTHAHRDHTQLAARLSKVTGAPVYAHPQPLLAETEFGGGEGVDMDFSPNIEVSDGQTVEGDDWNLQVLHTPGHLQSHVSLVCPTLDAIFSGDHVMDWSSTFISPPDGSLGSYLASLDRLSARPEKTYFPGHGPAVLDGHRRVADLRAHRHMRTAQILKSLGQGAASLNDLTARIYHDVPAHLHPAAARNVLAHLLHLQSDDRVHCLGDAPLRDRFCITSQD